MIIRSYQAKDAKAIQYICHVTAKGKRIEKSMKLTNALYCDYYIECEPQNCFVMVDEFDKPVGYILCSVDDSKYQREFAPYLKIAQRISFIDAVGHKMEQKLTTIQREQFPAHLHINILPSFQNKGGGRELINTLFFHLKSLGIQGLRLCVAQSNLGAISFYERLGFVRQKRLGSFAYVYAIKLN